MTILLQSDTRSKRRSLKEPEPPSLKLRLAVHDASRLEWICSIPLPETTKTEKFSFEFELEVPAHLFSQHDYWKNLQYYSRLESPTESGEAKRALSHPDQLRELALASAHRIKSAKQDFVRDCLLANSLLSPEPSPARIERLTQSFAQVRDELLRARERLLGLYTDECVGREALLVDEFLSNQFLEFMMRARRAIDEQLTRPGGRHSVALKPVADQFEVFAQEAIKAEVCHREVHSFLTPTAQDPSQLERYLERANLLKKHFQELLFLQPSSRVIDIEMRNWGALLGAMVASLFAFALNSELLRGTLANAGLGIGVIALAGAFIYAVQDRIKEAGRNFFTSRAVRLYAQRVTTLLTPKRHGEPIRLAIMKEGITVERHAHPDPLNPDLDAKREVVVLRYVAHGSARGEPSQPSWRGIKHIFRYDLSWLFARLDDPLKKVPIVERSGGLALGEAARCYRMPVRLRMTSCAGSTEASAIAVLHKRGLERFESTTGDLLK